MAQTLVYSLQNTETAEALFLSDTSQKTTIRYVRSRKQASADLAALKALIGESQGPTTQLASHVSHTLSQLDHVAQLRNLGRSAEAISTLQGMVSGTSADDLRQLNASVAASETTSYNNLKSALLALSAAAFVLTLVPAILLTLMRRATHKTVKPDGIQNNHGLPLVHALPVDIQRTEEQFQRIVETARDGIWVVNTDGATTLVNPRMAEILGYSVKEMLGRQHVDFMDAEGVKIAEDNIRRRKAGLPDTEDFRFVRKDGRTIWAMVATNPLKDGKGAVIGAVAMVTDITSRKQAENERILYKDAIKATGAAMLIVDAKEDMSIMFVNRAFETLSGYCSSEVLGHPATMLEGVDDSGNNVCPLRIARSRGSDIRIKLRSVRKNGSGYRYEVCVAPARNERGEITQYVVVLTDLAERQPSHEALISAPIILERVIAPTAENSENAPMVTIGEHAFGQSMRDELTGLNNGRTFEEDLEHETQRSFRYNTALSVLILDIDNLPELVDALGLSAGNQAIKQIGEIIQDTARQTDRVARIAGSRFSVIMINTDQPNSTVLAERLRRNIERGNWSPSCPITATVGIATLGVGMTGMHEFMNAAEEALLHAQARGRNQVAHRAQFDEALVNG